MYLSKKYYFAYYFRARDAFAGGDIDQVGVLRQPFEVDVSADGRYALVVDMSPRISVFDVQVELVCMYVRVYMYEQEKGIGGDGPMRW